MLHNELIKSKISDMRGMRSYENIDEDNVEEWLQSGV